MGDADGLPAPLADSTMLFGAGFQTSPKGDDKVFFDKPPAGALRHPPRVPGEEQKLRKKGAKKLKHPGLKIIRKHKDADPDMKMEGVGGTLGGSFWK
eukprot:gene5424-14303_t